MVQFVTVDPSQDNHGDPTELLDSFRYLHPEREKAYTCWSTLLDSRKINYGTRIDYILISKSMSPQLEKAEVWQQVEGSDHCPVFAELCLNLVPSPTAPSLCSKHFSGGRQRKLFDFISQKTKSGVSSASSGDTEKPKGKRSGSTADIPSTAKARKLESGKRQTTLAISSRPSSKSTENEKEESRLPVAADVSCAVEKDTDSVDANMGDLQPSSQGSAVDGSQGEASGDGTGRKLSQAWLGVFGGPPKPPLCKGHSEPCVLRTVKKQGPNKNKQFWVCARPGGGKGDPEARCDFFQWRNSKRK